MLIDTNWFCSTLAQSTAGLAGLLGGLLGIRLQPQHTETFAARKDLRRLVSDFRINVVNQEDGARSQREGLADRTSPEEQARHALWVAALPVFEAALAADTMPSLEALVKQASDVLPTLGVSDARASVSYVRDKAEELLAANRTLGSIGATGYAWAMTLVLGFMGYFGLVEPLRQLDGLADGSKQRLLCWFTIALAALLLVLAAQVFRVWAASRVGSFKAFVAEPL